MLNKIDSNTWFRAREILSRAYVARRGIRGWLRWTLACARAAWICAQNGGK